MMIARIWHGWTRCENANDYETLLREEIFPEIESRKIPGYRGLQLLRRTAEDDEDEFVTIMWFDSWDSVKAFAGVDYEFANVPAKARLLLARFDERSRHYEVKERIEY